MDEWQREGRSRDRARTTCQPMNIIDHRTEAGSLNPGTVSPYMCYLCVGMYNIILPQPKSGADLTNEGTKAVLCGATPCARCGLAVSSSKILLTHIEDARHAHRRCSSHTPITATSGSFATAAPVTKDSQDVPRSPVSLRTVFPRPCPLQHVGCSGCVGTGPVCVLPSVTVVACRSNLHTRPVVQ